MPLLKKKTGKRIASKENKLSRKNLLELILLQQEKIKELSSSIEEANMTLEHFDTTIIEKELARIRYKRTYSQVLRSTFFALVVVAAIAVLIATMLLPVLNIYGESMAPTLNDGDIVACVKGGSFESGSTIAFYYNNKILVKRVIASAGQWVDIDEDGNVFVDGAPLSEPYLLEKAYGQCNIELPYQVPEGRYFVMGDNREISADSRVSEIGCIHQEVIIGQLALRAWPFGTMGLLMPAKE